MLFTIDAIEFDVTIFEVIPAFKRFFSFANIPPPEQVVTTLPLGFSQYLGGGALYANKGLLQAVMVKLAISAHIRVEICIVSLS